VGRHRDAFSPLVLSLPPALRSRAAAGLAGVAIGLRREGWAAKTTGVAGCLAAVGSFALTGTPRSMRTAVARAAAVVHLILVASGSVHCGRCGSFAPWNRASRRHA